MSLKLITVAHVLDQADEDTMELILGSIENKTSKDLFLMLRDKYLAQQKEIIIAISYKSTQYIQFSTHTRNIVDHFYPGRKFSDVPRHNPVLVFCIEAFFDEVKAKKVKISPFEGYKIVDQTVKEKVKKYPTDFSLEIEERPWNLKEVVVNYCKMVGLKYHNPHYDLPYPYQTED